MNDRQLLDELLKRQESDDLDFKSGQYDLDNKDGRSRLIKDIVAMVNTPRSGSAYILIGVEETSGKVTGTPGVANHPDGSELGRIVQSKVDPSPRFNYRQVQYKHLDIGLIEIPDDQTVPVLPREDYGVLRRKAFYTRRNTQNTEADREDIRRIVEWGQPKPSPAVSAITGTWEQLYRACDAFDARKVHVAILSKESQIDDDDWVAMASVHWNVIIDFDSETDTDGNYASAKDFLGKRRALHLSALDQLPAITTRSTVWVAAAGLTSRPTTGLSTNWRDWNRSKSPRLEQILNELARITEPAPVTLLVFGGDHQYVSTVCEAADRAFAHRAEYIFANSELEQYQEIAERLDASSVPIALPEVCQGLRELNEDAGAPEEISFPKLEGGTTTISPDRARWLEEQLELVHWNIGLTPISQVNEESFLRGGTVSWHNLNVGLDADRDITTKLEQQIRQELQERATRRVNLWHWPGAGATTVARRTAWNIQRNYPTVVVADVQPQETAERVQHLFNVTRLPLFVVIDLPAVTKEVVDRFYDTLRGSHVPAVLLIVERRFDALGASAGHYLDAMLTTREAFGMARALAARVPDRQTDLESLIDEPDRRKRSPFYFGLVAYGRDFRGLQSYVAARLSKASQPIRDAVLLIAFAYFYGQVPLSLQTFGPIFNISASKLVAISNVIPDYMRELLVEANGKVRPAHNLIAEEILQQELGQKIGATRNWRIGLADMAIRFIDLLADLPHRDRGPISDILRAVLIERGSAQSPAGPWEVEFSRCLTDIPSVEGRQRVLEHLTETFPEEPHFWAHLGRFYSRAVRDHEKAHTAHTRAILLLPDDTLLHHMAGMGWRAELYDLLAMVKHDITEDQESRMHAILEEATREFEKARALDRRSEYNYISQVQMIQRFVGMISRNKGYRDQPLQFLANRGNDSYRELIDQAQNLLSDLALVKGIEAPSQLQVKLQADLEGLYGRHSEAIQQLTNVLDRRESYRPPLRRAIIRAYIAKNRGDWNGLDDRELARVVELARDNIEEEPASDHNLRLWLRAVRAENALSVDRVAERLAYKRLQNPSVDTTFYLYIMKFLQLESGDLAAASEVPDLIAECGDLARDLARTTTSFEWLGREGGLSALVHISTLGSWDVKKNFWPNTEHLRPIRGRIAQIRNHGSGEIELTSGLRVFFIPSRGAVPGGYVAGQDIGREVEFFLGFSYDGLRAWSVHDPTA